MRGIHQSFDSMLGCVKCPLLLGLLAMALQGISAAEASDFKVYVTNFNDNNVSVIDTVRFQTVGGPIPVGVGPIAIAITPDGSGRIYVANLESDSVSLLSPPTTISVDHGPRGIAITPDGAYAYVANGDSDTVTVFATATNQIVKTVPFPTHSFPLNIAISDTPNGTRAYVTNSFSNNVSVIDTASNSFVTGPGYPIPVGLGPGGIAITPDGTRAYVTSGPNVVVIDTASNPNQVMGDPIPVTSPERIAITPDGTRVYVTNDGGNVSVIDTGSNQVIATVTGGPPEGSHPVGIAIDEDGIFAYVANARLGSVSVIDTRLNAVVAEPIRVGHQPFAIAIIPHHVVLNFFAVWSGGSTKDIFGLPTTFTVPVDNPSLVASVAWDFYGDGTAVQTTSTATTQFTYTRAGNFGPKVTVFLTDGSSASATRTLSVQSPAQAISTAVSLVDWLSLPSGPRTSLVSKLNAASDASTRGDTQAACGEMHAFENEVDALVQSGRLDQASAAPRLGQAQAIRLSLRCS